MTKITKRDLINFETFLQTYNGIPHMAKIQGCHIDRPGLSDWKLVYEVFGSENNPFASDFAEELSRI